MCVGVIRGNHPLDFCNPALEHRWRLGIIIIRFNLSILLLIFVFFWFWFKTYFFGNLYCLLFSKETKKKKFRWAEEPKTLFKKLTNFDSEFLYFTFILSFKVRKLRSFCISNRMTAAFIHKTRQLTRNISGNSPDDTIPLPLMALICQIRCILFKLVKWEEQWLS